MMNLTDNNNQKLNEIEIKSNTSMFYNGKIILLKKAGYETTSNTLQWCFFYLSINEFAKNKVLEEINNFDFENNTNFLSYEEHFKYTKCVILESLRLRNPAYILPREANENITIGDKYNLHKGVIINIMLNSLNHDKSFWGDDVLEFKPERFYNKKIDPLYFIPFGIGIYNYFY
jgi:cytochrome P450